MNPSQPGLQVQITIELFSFNSISSTYTNLNRTLTSTIYSIKP